MNVHNDLDVGQLQPALQVPGARWEGQPVAPPPGYACPLAALVTTLEHNLPT